MESSGRCRTGGSSILDDGLNPEPCRGRWGRCRTASVFLCEMATSSIAPNVIRTRIECGLGPDGPMPIRVGADSLSEVQSHEIDNRGCRLALRIDDLAATVPS